MSSDQTTDDVTEPRPRRPSPPTRPLWLEGTAPVDEPADEAADAPADEPAADEDAEADETERLAQLEREGDVAADYLEELLDIADLDGDLDMDVEGDRASVSIVGGDLDRLVGRNGEVLDALQELPGSRCCGRPESARG